MNVADIDVDSYALSPMQESLLFHTLYDQGAGLYIEQFIFDFPDEDLNIAAFRRSWETVVGRHDTLRASFHWRGLEIPQQHVHGAVQIPFDVQDCRNLSPSRQKRRLEAYLRADRRKGFTPTEAPLMRVAMFRMQQTHHQCVWTFHHLLVDGRSAVVILKEVFALYEALCQEIAVPFPPAGSFRDHIAALERHDGSVAEAFWRQTLHGFTAPTPLVVDRPVSGEHAGLPRECEIQLDASVTAALRALTDRHQLTLNTIVQGSWALLLSRYSGEEDVVFGVTRACRRSTVADAEGIVGVFMNTVPMRVRASRDAPLIPWLMQLRVQQLAARDYEHTRPVDIQRWSEIPAGTPLFESVIDFTNYSLTGPLRWLGHRWETSTLHVREKTNYAININAWADPALSLRIVYDPRRFEHDSIRRMLGHLQTILKGMATNPERRLRDLPLLSEPERNQVMVEWNNTAAHYPHHVCLHHLIEAQAARTPDRPAVCFDNQRLSYEELNARANQLAHYLRQYGVGPNVLVGIFIERSLEMVLGLLGILKAGGAYVPIDPDYPGERVAFMVEDAGISLLLTRQDVARKLPAHSARTICLDSDWTKIATYDAANPAVDSSGEHLAYMIYTSGSTGRPKGALNTHRGICNRLLWMQDRYQLGPSDTVLQKTPFSFDVSVWEFFWPLITGARLVVARPGGHRDPSSLARLIRDERVTVMHFVPSMLRAFLAEPTVSSCTSLRDVMCSGEALPHDLQEAFFCRLACDLHNLYGPTEAAVDVTHWTCRRDTKSSVVPIGRPIANTQIYILDDELSPVPVGVAGELYIGGVQVGRGYHNRPELTKEKFIRDPFSSDSTARLYRTGDRARWLQNGAVEYLGRFDSQVKVRGNRIELGEIEHVLAEHAGVKDVVVIARDDPAGNAQLIAYVIPTRGDQAPATEAVLRAFLRDRLPDYMIPAAFVLMVRFPLTPNGKLDRKALPSPDYRVPAATVEFVAPRDSLEQTLARIWCRILRVKRVGVHDNFFDLGGHSLAAARFVSEVERLTGKLLSIATLFDAPTIAGLAKILRTDSATASWSSLIPIQTGGSRNPLFLVHAAHGTVLLYRQVCEHLGQDQPVYGLQSQGLNGQRPLQTTVEEMASLYMREIATVQPEGPYFLAGYCSGGIIALELAQQLSRRGEDVVRVILLDTYNLSTVPRWHALVFAPIHLIQNAWFHCANGFSVRGKNRRAFLGEKVNIGLTRVGTALESTARAIGSLRRSRRQARRSLVGLKRTNDRAAYRYIPRPYTGRVVLIRSKGCFAGFTSPTFGWNHVLQTNLVVHQLPVYQRGMLIEPFCRMLGATIRAELDGADTAAQRP